MQQYYIPTARELARLAGIQRAPILHHFAESLSGAATIRAFDHQERFTNANLCLIDNHSRPWFHNVAAMEWLSFRLNQLANFVFAFSLVLLVSLPEGIINPSKLNCLTQTHITDIGSFEKTELIVSFCFRHCRASCDLWNKFKCLASFSHMEYMQCRKQNDIRRTDSSVLESRERSASRYRR